MEGCAQDDYLTPMYEDIKGADGIVVGAPIYFLEPCAQAKVWLDRMYPMWGAQHDEVKYPGKKYFTIYPIGDIFYDYFIGEMDFFDRMLSEFGWQQLGRIICAGTYEIPDFRLPEEMLSEAFSAGTVLGSYSAPPITQDFQGDTAFKRNAPPRDWNALGDVPAIERR
jgi:hypothetical protein